MDVLHALGKIDSRDKALDLLSRKMDKTQLDRISDIKTADILIRIANAAALCNPDTVFINTGSDEDKAFIRNTALEKKKSAPWP